MTGSANYIVIIMLIIMGILLLAIILLANVFTGLASYVYHKEKEEEKRSEDKNTGGEALKVLTALLFMVFVSPGIFAQTAAEGDTLAVSRDMFSGLSPTLFYFMCGVLVTEVIVVFFLLFQIRNLIASQQTKPEKLVREKKKWAGIAAWWNAINKFKPLEKEAEIELDHEYDGIRELDNKLPPWWLYGFYLTIIFAAVYLWTHHVSHTSPLSEQEFQIAMQKAEKDKQKYLKNSLNNVDENTVKLLTDATEIAGGKKIYEQSCSPCHGKNGEGVVGPNLTDDHWLHGGSLSDVFKSIKYGWPDKGMKSWKEDFSPVQLSQLTSYIRSIAGSHPANAKEAQGELYVAAAADSVSAKPVAQ